LTDLRSATSLQERLNAWPRAELACLPTPLHPLRRLTAELGGLEVWIKRDDLTGLAGGGNKTRKLEFVVGDALAVGAKTLVTVGALQSNHTRQTAAAAARVGLDCVLLHNDWAPSSGAAYRRVGNLLLSELLGATLYHDPTAPVVGDEGMLPKLVAHLHEEGKRPYVIPVAHPSIESAASAISSAPPRSPSRRRRSGSPSTRLCTAPAAAALRRGCSPASEHSARRPG
jgi:1-aminocyclopropane-1-carboxylate deaminase